MRFTLIGGLEPELSCSIYWGISYSQLTFIFFRGAGLNHQPGYVCVYIYTLYIYTVYIYTVYIYCIWFQSNYIYINPKPPTRRLFSHPHLTGCRPPCLGRDPLRFSFADGDLWRSPPGPTAKLRGWEFWVLLWQQWGLVGGLEHFLFSISYMG